jgi:hypothetical protein
MKKFLDPDLGSGVEKMVESGSGIKHPGSTTLLYSILYTAMCAYIVKGTALHPQCWVHQTKSGRKVPSFIKQKVASSFAFFV